MIITCDIEKKLFNCASINLKLKINFLNKI